MPPGLCQPQTVPAQMKDSLSYDFRTDLPFLVHAYLVFSPHKDKHDIAETALSEGRKTEDILRQRGINYTNEKIIKGRNAQE